MANPNLGNSAAAKIESAHRLRVTTQVGRRLRELIKDKGVDPGTAADQVLEEVINDPINAEIDWSVLLPFIMELIMLLLQIFEKQK